MTWPEVTVLVISAIVIPWLVFITKAVLALKSKLDRIGSDVKWIRREHEPEDGVQRWKNPGLHDAIEKLSEQLERLGDRIERVLRETGRRPVD